jgi:uncharacterized protein YkwD
MKSSLILAVTSAAVSMASPIFMHIAERDLVTETIWHTELVTVTVTAGIEPTSVPEVIEPPAKTTKEAEPEPTTEVVVPEPEPTVVIPEPEPTVVIPEPEPTTEAPEPTTAIPEPEPTPEEPEPTTSAAPPPPEPSSPSVGNYADAMLEHHNIHRANHSAPALQWDAELAQYADNIAKGCQFEHDMEQGEGGYGQNLASWGSTGDIDDKQIAAGSSAVTEQWYNGEFHLWNFYGMDDPPADSDFHGWGHFTQVLWKDTTKLGCATVSCPAGTVLTYPSWYTVCNYGGPGNYGGQYGDNVLEPLGQSTVNVELSV